MITKRESTDQPAHQPRDLFSGRSPIIALMSVTTRPGVYRCQYKSHVVEHKAPEGRLARQLLLAEYDPQRVFRTKWASGPESLQWPSLAAAASGDVHENDKQGLHWRKWRPFPEEALA